MLKVKSNQKFKDKINWIKDQWDCVRYASQVLGWPIHQDGDRYTSIAPDSQNETALIVHTATWHDFKTGNGGDVIDLCAWAKYDGDKGQAIRELGQGFPDDTSYEESNWMKQIQDFCNKVQFWHERLRPEDVEYLHSRHITDETIERLKLGYDENTQRLTIPYFKNGYVVYCAGRDRMPVPEKWIVSLFDDPKENPEYLEYKKLNRSKYQKMFLDGFNENVPWGLHTLTPQYRKSRTDKLRERYPMAGDVLCLLEGAFDVMSFEQEGFICLSPIGGYFSKRAKKQVIDIARNFQKVFICFDNDKAGERFNLDMAKLLFENRIQFVMGQVPLKVGEKDIKDISKAEILLP